jgi:hypothetical protein
MIPILDEILVGSSAAALVTYLLAKIRCLWKNPCTENQICIYGSNESHIANVDDDENEIIIITAKKNKPIC